MAKNVGQLSGPLPGSSSSWGWSAPPPPAQPEHHGLLHNIVHGAEHIAGQTVSDLESAAINSPAGLYHLGGGLIHDPIGTVENIGKSMWTDFQHPLRHPGYTLLDTLGLVSGVGGLVSRVGELGRVAEGASTLRFPAAATEAERAAGDFTAVSGGKQAARAFVHGAPVPERVIRSGDLEIDPATGQPMNAFTQKGWSYSRNASIRGGQKLLDSLHEKYQEGTPLLWKSQIRRQASAGKNLQVVEKGLLRSAAAQLVRKYRNLPPALHEAITMVGRGVLPEDQAAFIQDRLASGELKGRTLKESKAALTRTEEAAQFLESKTVKTDPSEAIMGKNSEGKDVVLRPAHPGGTYQLPVLKDELPKELGLSPKVHQEFLTDARNLSRDREVALLQSGVLTQKGWLSRLLGPKSIIEGHGLPPDIPKLRKQAASMDRLNNVDAAKKIRDQITDHYKKIEVLPGDTEADTVARGYLADPNLAEHLFRVPEVISPAARAIEGFSKRFTGSKPKTPGTLTHTYTGGVLKHGGGRWNVAETVAEDYIEAQRFLGLKNLREKLLASARPTPDGIPENYAMPIVADEWRGKLPDSFKYAKQLLTEDRQLSSTEAQAGGRFFEPIRQFLTRYEGKTADEVASERGNLEGVKWIDRRQLAGLDKQNPLWSAMESPAIRGVLKGVDAVNNAQKAMILYLKPAYLIPNMLGNVALNLVQQGFLAPFNMGKTLKVMFTGKGLTTETVSTIKVAMGGGLTSVLRKDSGLLSGVSNVGNKVGGLYGKVIDDPFRFSAFLHEARVEGFTSAEDLRKLTQDPGHADKLREVSQRANDAIINYERLGPGEQAVLRRLVFFYPWVKGSSRYAYQLAVNHPLTASGSGQAGKEGEEWIHNTLGDLPSYAEGLIPYSTKNKNLPIVGNPQSAAILGQSADIVKAVGNLLHGNPNPDLSLAGNLAPVDAALLTLLTSGKLTTIPHSAKEAPIVSAFNQLVGGNPLVGSRSSLVENLTGGPTPPNSLYPDNSPTDALLKFLALGGLGPRVLNKAKANETAFKQTHPTGFSRR